MSKIRYLSIIWVVLLVLLGCQSNFISANATDSQPKWFSKHNQFDTKLYYQFFNEFVATKEDNVELQLFYLQQQIPFWTEDGFRENKINQWLLLLDSAKYHGIPPNMVGLSKIVKNIDSLKTNTFSNSANLFQQLAELEWLCSEAYLHYAKILAFGATNPKKMMGSKWYHKTDTVTPEFRNNALANLKSFDTYLHRLPPKTITYNKLQDELSVLLVVSKKDSLAADSLKVINIKISKLEVNLERNRWRVLPAKPSSFLMVNIPDFTVSAYLNDTLAIQNKICCGKSYNATELSKLTPKEGIYPHSKWASPFLYSEIEQLVLNPEWNIPPSIVKDEYFHKLIKDNMAVVNKEKLYVLNARYDPIAPDTINWKRFSPKAIPYKLIQTSGYHNALGIIKFNFKNPESVYLHDTPQKAAFNKTNRAVSHGCIRVQNPLLLAEVIYLHNKLNELQIEKINIDLRFPAKTKKGEEYLKEKAEKEQKYFAELSEERQKYYRPLRPIYYNLSKKYPVYIEYFTCFVDSLGKVQYRDDVYQKDPAIKYQFDLYR